MFFFRQTRAYEIWCGRVGSDVCIRDSSHMSRASSFDGLGGIRHYNQEPRHNPSQCQLFRNRMFLALFLDGLVGIRRHSRSHRHNTNQSHTSHNLALITF